MDNVTTAGQAAFLQYAVHIEGTPPCANDPQQIEPAQAAAFAAADPAMAEACGQTIDSLFYRPDILCRIPPSGQDALRSVRNALSASDLDQIGLQRLAYLAIGLLDIFALNEAAPDNREMELRNYYARGRGYSKRLVIAEDELQAVFKHLAQEKWKAIDSVGEISHLRGHTFYLNRVLDISQEQALRERIEKIVPRSIGKVSVCAAYRTADAVQVVTYERTPHVVFLSNTEKLDWIESNSTEILTPPTHMPRQEFWNAQLKSGIRFISADEDTVSASHVPSSDVDSALRRVINESVAWRSDMWKEGGLRRLKILLSCTGREDKFDRFLAGHVRHYEALFEHEGSRPSVTFTRSGVSANEIAIDAAARLAGPGAKACMHQGWYFENSASISKGFGSTNDIDEATALFVAIPPCFPEKQIALELEKAGNSRYLSAQEMISRFLANAVKNPGKRFTLVLDKTSDLLYSPMGETGMLPSNLTIIETFSLTKHQRGASNYFYGGLALWGNSRAAAAVAEAEMNIPSRLTPLGIVNLPRLTATEIKQRADKFISLNLAFAEGFEDAQIELPQHLRWQTEVHGHFMYVLPPLEYMFAIAERALAGGRLDRTFINKNDCGDQQHFDIRPSFPFRCSPLPEETDWLSAIGIYYADSFGLNDSRLSTVSHRMKGVISDADSKRPWAFDTYALRFAPGFNEEREDVLEKGHALGWHVAVRMLAMIKEEEENRTIKERTNP